MFKAESTCSRSATSRTATGPQPRVLLPLPLKCVVVPTKWEPPARPLFFFGSYLRRNKEGATRGRGASINCAYGPPFSLGSTGNWYLRRNKEGGWLEACSVLQSYLWASSGFCLLLGSADVYFFMRRTNCAPCDRATAKLRRGN